MKNVNENTKKAKNKIIKDLLIIIVVGIIINHLINTKFNLFPDSNNLIDKMKVLYFSLSLVAGWRSLSNLVPKGGLFNLVFFVWLKVSIASVIGSFVLPFRLISNINKLIKLS